MINERLDLTDKKNWLHSNPKKIAEHFGYVPDENFREALGAFIEEVVSPATVTNLLASVAHGFFLRWRPPLKLQGGGAAKGDNNRHP